MAEIDSNELGEGHNCREETVTGVGGGEHREAAVEERTTVGVGRGEQGDRCRW